MLAMLEKLLLLQEMLSLSQVFRILKQESAHASLCVENRIGTLTMFTCSQ